MKRKRCGAQPTAHACALRTWNVTPTRSSTKATATRGSMWRKSGRLPSPAPIFKLLATLRSSAGVPVGFRATGNPGGPGHQWVKARYIDPAPLGNRIICDEQTNLKRVFIPSKVDNNRHIDVEAYKQRL